MERWRASLELEAELSNMEKSEGAGEQGEWNGEEEVKREVERDEEETML